MAGLMDLLGDQILGKNAGAIGQLLGEDETKVNSAMGAALPMILGALSKNAANPKGAEALHKAINKDHDGSVLNDVGGYLNKADQGPGDGILGHVLGKRRAPAEQAVSKASGMDSAKVAKMMTMLAPLVLGALGKSQREKKMDASSLSNFLGQEKGAIQQRMPKEMGMLDRLLDADGDGDVDINDMIKGAGKLFGGR